MILFKFTFTMKDSAIFVSVARMQIHISLSSFCMCRVSVPFLKQQPCFMPS